MQTPDALKETSEDLKLERMLTIASVFEGPFSIDWIIQLTGGRVSETISLLNLAVENGSLAQNGQSDYVFRDKRLRKKLRSAIPTDELQQFHEQIAEILIAELPEDEKKPTCLSAHLLHTKNDPDRCRWLYKAGDQYLKEYRIGKALHCFSKIFDDLSRHRDETANPLFIDTAIKYAKHASIRFNIDYIVATLEQAIANAETLGDNNKRPLLYMLLAHNEWLRGNFETALKHFETGRKLSQNIESPALKVYAVTFSVYFYYWQGLFGQAVAEYEAHTSPQGHLHIDRFPFFPGIIIGFCYAQIGRIEHGMALIEHIRRQGIERNSPFLTVAATVIMSCAMLLYERFEEALDYIDTASSTGEKAGLEVTSTFCNLVYAYTYYRQQQFEKAGEHLARFWQKKDEHEQVIQWLYPLLLDLAWGAHIGELPAIEGLSFINEVRKTLISKNLFYRGYGYRYAAFRMQHVGEPQIDIVETLKESFRYLKKSGSRIEQAKSLAELMVHYTRIGHTQKITQTRDTIGCLLSEISISFVPRRFRPLLDKTHADSLIVTELKRLGRQTRGFDDPLDFLGSLVASASHMIGAERGAIFLRSETGESESDFKPLLMHNLSEDTFYAPANRLLRDLVARGANAPDGILVFPGREAIETGTDLPRSAVCVPVAINGQIAGAVYHDNRLLHDAFTEKDLHLLQFFTPLVAMALRVLESRKAVERYQRQDADERLDIRIGPANDSPEDPMIVGQSHAIGNVLRMIEQVAETDATVLILGETGVGKELVARSIHRRSRRATDPFLSVNCNAIPETIIASELFGHEKGAFTGASQRRIGRFELADRGTLFLDEIGDLPIDIQVGLLRILQTRQFERVGSSETLTSNFRLIAATNRDLESAVQQGEFREDLFYRLNIFPIHVPPLRERKADIPLIAHHFLQQYAEAHSKNFRRFPQSEMDKLMAHEWPGNVRELENVIQRGVILSTGPAFYVPDIATKGPFGVSEENAPVSLKDMEKAHILKILEQSRWKIRGKGGAAERLDIHPSTLRSRMKKLGIARPQKN